MVFFGEVVDPFYLRQAHLRSSAQRSTVLRIGMDLAQEIAKVKVEDANAASADKEPEKELTPEELKAKKRAEIIANLAKARAEQEQKALEEKVTYPDFHCVCVRV